MADTSSSSAVDQSHIATNDQSSELRDGSDTHPLVTNSGMGIFAGAHHFTVTGSQFVELHGNYVQINNTSVAPTEVIPPLPPPRNSSIMFTGRGTYLDRLQDYFGSNITEKRRSFLLHGMGGIGKTQICLKFIEENRFSDIFWVDASSESTIDLGLKQIAKASNAFSGTPSAAFALKWISKKSNWLMIYDNADGGYQVVEKFLPPGNGGNILMTSRNSDLVRITENSMEIQEMEEEEALLLLSKSAGLTYPSDELMTLAKQLVSKLGGIPLAIDQAGAYMMACRSSLEDYLELYVKNQDELLSNNFFKGASDYGSSTYGTWEISMKEIETRAAKGIGSEAIAAQGAITLYKIIAFMHHESIPEELFQAAAVNYKKRDISAEQKLGLPLLVTMLNPKVLFLDKKGEWDKMQFQLGMHVLLSFSLIKKNGKMYSIHPLINSWNRSRIPETEMNVQILIARAMLACSVELNYGVDNYKFCGLLVSHIRANSNHHTTKLNPEDAYYDDECTRFALVFHHAGNWHEAEKLEAQAVEARKKKLGLHHPGTLTSMRNLASTYWNQGKWDESEKLDIQVMEVAGKDKLGSHYRPDILADMENLASTYQKQGKWDEAEKIHLQVMEARREKIGPGHLETLRSMANLASIYRNQGRWDEAEKLELQVMMARKEKLGPHHPETVTSLGNLACTYWEQGRWHEAEKLQVQVMEAQKEKLGSNHPHTLTSIGNLASTYRKQGKWDEAEKLHLQVMEASKETLGPYHPDTLRAVANLASTYRNQGRWSEAEKLYLNVIEQRKEKLGPYHPDTLSSMGNLASTYGMQGRWTEAEKLHLQVMEARKEKLGSHHQDTLTSMANIANIFMNQGRLDEAEKLELQVMKASKEKLGPCHPDTLSSMGNLATTYWKQGRWEEAEKLYVQVMNANKEKLGPYHPNTLTIMTNLAAVYCKQGKWDEAEKLDVHVMEARREKLGAHHPSTLRSIANLAVTYQGRGRLDEAKSLLLSAVGSMDNIMGSQHPTTIHFKKMLGQVQDALAKGH